MTRMTARHLTILGLGAALLLAGCTASTEDPELPDNDLSLLPETGVYRFIMDDSGTLSGQQCPETAVTPATDGPAHMIAAADGLSLTLTVAGKTITFSRATTADILTSAVMQFPVEDNEDTYIGEVTYTLDYWTQNYAQGVLQWNNGLGCTGDYPFTLEPIYLGD